MYSLIRYLVWDRLNDARILASQSSLVDTGVVSQQCKDRFDEWTILSRENRVNKEVGEEKKRGCFKDKRREERERARAAANLGDATKCPGL